jgi:methylenetetrahydrofolate reductase (NADPH)
MKVDSKLAQKIESGDFIITAEYLPTTAVDSSLAEAALNDLGNKPVAVNIADNHYGVATSSLAISVAVIRFGAEPVFQLVTRDRNRIALQSDLLGAAYLGIKNVLCLSGYHQTLTGCSESANVYDIDSIQLIEAVTKMCEENVLLNGTKIQGRFSMLVGAVANPYLEQLELNMLRMSKKIEAGARFIQTQAVFDIETFSQWLDALCSEGLSEKTAILAGVMPLDSAAEAEKLRDTYTDFYIPDEVVERLKAAGQQDAQKKEGLAICAQTMKEIKKMDGLRGIHILSGGKEAVVPELLAVSGL